MSFTAHGHWVGRISPGPDDVPPQPVTQCGGPPECPPCAREAIDAGQTGLDEVAASETPAEPSETPAEPSGKPCFCPTCRSPEEG